VEEVTPVDSILKTIKKAVLSPDDSPRIVEALKK
jgi:hypothetical protein